MKKATMETEKGTIILELFPNEAPGTVANFEKLANSGFYDGLTFHRVIPNFVIQGGDPNGNGTGGPGYTIKCETEGNPHKHGTGALSMAHAGKDTGGSQFFITHSPQPHLDGVHTVFGRSPPPPPSVGGRRPAAPHPVQASEPQGAPASAPKLRGLGSRLAALPKPCISASSGARGVALPTKHSGTRSLPAETQEDPSLWGPRNPAPSGVSPCTPGSEGRPAGHHGPSVTSRNASADILDAGWVPTASMGGVMGRGVRRHLASFGGDCG